MYLFLLMTYQLPAMDAAQVPAINFLSMSPLLQSSYHLLLLAHSAVWNQQHFFVQRYLMFPVGVSRENNSFLFWPSISFPLKSQTRSIRNRHRGTRGNSRTQECLERQRHASEPWESSTGNICQLPEALV